MKAHTKSPFSTRRSNHAAYSNSPPTLTVVAKSFSTIASLDFVHHECEERFSPLVPSSTRFHHPRVPVDEMSLVLFGSYPHPSGSSSSHCLSQRLFWTSSGWDLLNSNSAPAVVCPDLQFHVSPPPLMLFGGSRPRHLDMSCIHECVTSPNQESHMPFIQEFCQLLTECFRVHSLTSNLRCAFFWRKCRWRYCGNFSRSRCCRHLFIWT